MSSRRPLSVRAFTLVEALAAITILATIMAVSSGIIVNAAEGYADASAVATATIDADASLTTITDLLRSIPLAAGGGGTLAADISGVTAGSITWTGGESLALSGTTLSHTPAGGGGSTPLVLGVTAFSVRCYDENNAAMAASLSGAACAPIRRIEITLSLQRSGASATLRTRVFPRALTNGGAP